MQFSKYTRKELLFFENILMPFPAPVTSEEWYDYCIPLSIILQKLDFFSWHIGALYFVLSNAFSTICGLTVVCDDNNFSFRLSVFWFLFTWRSYTMWRLNCSEFLSIFSFKLSVQKSVKRTLLTHIINNISVLKYIRGVRTSCYKFKCKSSWRDSTDFLQIINSNINKYYRFS